LARPTSGTLSGASWTNVSNTLWIKQFTTVLASIDIGNGNADTGVIALQEATPGIAMASADVASAVAGLVAVGATAPLPSTSPNGDRGPATFSYSGSY
jgi:hypothetical protein